MTWVLTSPAGARYCLVMILAARDNTTLPSPLWLQAVARQVIDRLPIWIAAKEPKASATATATNPTAKATTGKAGQSKATTGSRRASQSPTPATPASSRASTARPDKATSSPRYSRRRRAACVLPRPVRAPHNGAYGRSPRACRRRAAVAELAVGWPPQGRYRARPWAGFSVNAYKFGYKPRSTVSAINAPKK